MIRVARKPEPPEFHSQVRVPGRQFLAATARPTAREWHSHSYWRRVARKLYDEFEGICAYSCHWIPFDTGGDTVEHFKPKDKYQNLAYEWRNYRLVCATLNGRKGQYQDVLDPFRIENGWFVISFPSMLVMPKYGITRDRAKKIKATIARLGLNDEGTCLRSRVKWLSDYCSGHITFDYLLTHAPFVAYELERQDLTRRIRQVFLLSPGACVGKAAMAQTVGRGR